MNLTDIAETIGGFEVKNLRYKTPDNIIVGQVKDLVFLSKIHDGYVCVAWRLNGSLLNMYGGTTRKDLYLKFNK